MWWLLPASLRANCNGGMSAASSCRRGKGIAACTRWRTWPRWLSICELRDRGFSLQRVRKVMRALKAEFGKRLAETVSGASDCHLLTDGKHIYLETSAKQIVDILKNSRQPMLAICVSDTVRRLRTDVRGCKKGKRFQIGTAFLANGKEESFITGDQSNTAEERWLAKSTF